MPWVVFHADGHYWHGIPDLGQESSVLAVELTDAELADLDPEGKELTQEYFDRAVPMPHPTDWRE